MRIVAGSEYKLIEVASIDLPQAGAPPQHYDSMLVFIRKEYLKEAQLIYDTIALADLIVADGKIVKNRWA